MWTLFPGKAGAFQSEDEDRGGLDLKLNSVAPGRNDSEGSPAAMLPCFPVRTVSDLVTGVTLSPLSATGRICGHS